VEISLAVSWNQSWESGGEKTIKKRNTVRHHLLI
jgi:hypothetical protein